MILNLLGFKVSELTRPEAFPPSREAAQCKLRLACRVLPSVQSTGCSEGYLVVLFLKVLAMKLKALRCQANALMPATDQPWTLNPKNVINGFFSLVSLFKLGPLFGQAAPVYTLER